MSKLKVNLNYKTGRMGENNCRIVSAGSELDRLYQETYDNYIKVQEWNEKKSSLKYSAFKSKKLIQFLKTFRKEMNLIKVCSVLI